MGATDGPFLVLTEHGKALAAAAKAKRLARQAAFWTIVRNNDRIRAITEAQREKIKITIDWEEVIPPERESERPKVRCRLCETENDRWSMRGSPREVWNLRACFKCTAGPMVPTNRMDWRDQEMINIANAAIRRLEGKHA